MRTPRPHIVVPVYNAFSDLQCCVESIKRHTAPGTYCLVLIDDASPDPQIATYFNLLEKDSGPDLVLLRNDRNLGFVGTVNRGMVFDTATDVILLNSDTIVTPGWFEKILRCADSDRTIGTITPFSNNAEICSFPAFCKNTPISELPNIDLIAEALEQAAVPVYPDIPTGIGFCMFVRRALIRKIGLFDEKSFGLGYGEENDFCMRAKKSGFRNVLCDDAFVAHTGSRSFDERKYALMEANLRKLTDMHPEYPGLVRAFIEADPLRPIRAVAMSRLHAISSPGARGILHVLHSRKGGTETHIRDLIRAGLHGYRQYLLTTVGDHWILEDDIGDVVLTYDIARVKDEPWADLLNAVCRSFRIDLCHIHHIAGARDGLLHAIAGLKCAYGLTLHDSYLACPTITLLGHDGEYCGAVTDAKICQSCLDRQIQYKGISISAWRDAHRSLIANARFIVAPTEWLSTTFRRYFPGTAIRVVPHGMQASELTAHAPEDMCSALLLPRDGKHAIGVLGAIGPVKGARRLERLVKRTRERGLALRWVLIGYLDRQYGPYQDKDKCFTVHGAYRSDHLGALLDHYGIRLTVFPSAGPESFSYTLSESWVLGRPALVPPIGALGERTERSGAGWLMERWQDENAILDQIESIFAQENQADFECRAAQARAMRLPSLQDMACATEEIYGPALKTAASLDGKVLDRRRLYRAVSQAEDPSPAVKTSADRMLRKLAGLGLRLRYTPVGHWLYRTTPLSWQRALKRRLTGA